MGLFGGGRATTEEQAKRAEQERAFLQGVVMHVMPDEFRSSVKTQATRPAAPPQPSVVVSPAPLPLPPAPRPKTKDTGTRKRILASLVSSQKRLMVWGGVAVLAIGGTVGALLLLSSRQPSTPSLVEQTTSESTPVLSDDQQTPPVEESVETPPADETPTQEVVRDTDSDGVSEEEETMYGSDPTRFDTDGDGYSDQQEIVNLYNPAGTAPVKLVDSGSVIVYAHPTEGFSLLIPRAWVVERDESAARTRVRAPNDAFIEVVLHENAQRLSAETWYRLQAKEEITGVFTPITHDNSEGVWVPDRSVAIVTKARAVGGPDRMAVIRVERGTTTPQQFETTWTMIVRSFQWTQ